MERGRRRERGRREGGKKRGSEIHTHAQYTNGGLLPIVPGTNEIMGGDSLVWVGMSNTTTAY